MSSLGEYFMNGAKREAALQHRIRLGMAKRHTVKRGGLSMSFNPLDAAAQGRKRACACAGHAPLLKRCSPVTVPTEPMTGSIVHDMF